MEGSTQGSRSIAPPSFIPGADPGLRGGGTYTSATQEPSIDDYERVFGPAARDIKRDPERNRRRQRLHLPDVLQGPNPWLTDRVDGLITDTDNSPFTSYILPYKHIDNVDAKIKWNVWSFDEGLASRVPYESSARVLTQTKRSFAGYTVRQGLAISMEANFMMSPEGRENFKNQLMQVVGSIQQTNDLDVHVALLQAPSYQQQQNEKFFSAGKTPQQMLREYVDLFGFLQKNPNGLDIAIEEAKDILRTWGAKEPSFLLTNSKLTMQLTMTPERTQYFTQGYEGVRRLKTGPEVGTYRGLKVIHSRAFSVETGARPRDLLNRRVRVAEYYRIPWHAENPSRTFEFYDESRDSWFSMTWHDLVRAARLPGDPDEKKVPVDADGVNLIGAVGVPTQTYPLVLMGDVHDNGSLPDAMNEPRRVCFANYVACSHNVFVPSDVWAVYFAHWHLFFDQATTPGRLPNRDMGALLAAAVPGIAASWLMFFSYALITPEIVRALTANINTTLAQVEVYAACRLHPGVGGAAATANPHADADHDLPVSMLALVYAALYETDNVTRQRFIDAVPTSAIDDLRAIYNAMLQSNEHLYRARTLSPNTYTQTYHDLTERPNFRDHRNARTMPSMDLSAQKRVDPFHVFLFVMLVRLYSDINLFTDTAVNAAGAPYRRLKNNGVNLDLCNLIPNTDHWFWCATAPPPIQNGNAESQKTQKPREIVVLRPNIEHNMLGVIMGRGGLDDLGGTLWGQTQLECYSDSMHGLWGMSYKYNERAIVWNEKNLVRLWDVCYGSYSGGKDSRMVSWVSDGPDVWREATNATNEPYVGPSVAVMSFDVDDNDLDWVRNWPSPIAYHSSNGNKLPCDPDNAVHITDRDMFPMWGTTYRRRFMEYQRLMPNFTELHMCTKVAGECAQENLTSTQNAIAFQGSMRVLNAAGQLISEIHGSGHHGPDYVGIASRRNGKGMNMTGRPGVPIFAAV